MAFMKFSFGRDTDKVVIEQTYKRIYVMTHPSYSEGVWKWHILSHLFFLNKNNEKTFLKKLPLLKRIIYKSIL